MPSNAGHLCRRVSVDELFELVRDLDENDVHILLDDFNNTVESNVAVEDGIGLFEVSPRRRPLSKAPPAFGKRSRQELLAADRPALAHSRGNANPIRTFSYPAHPAKDPRDVHAADPRDARDPRRTSMSSTSSASLSPKQLPSRHEPQAPFPQPASATLPPPSLASFSSPRPANKTNGPTRVFSAPQPSISVPPRPKTAVSEAGPQQGGPATSRAYKRISRPPLPATGQDLHSLLEAYLSSKYPQQTTTTRDRPRLTLAVSSQALRTDAFGLQEPPSPRSQFMFGRPDTDGLPGVGSISEMLSAT